MKIIRPWLSSKIYFDSDIKGELIFMNDTITTRYSIVSYFIFPHTQRSYHRDNTRLIVIDPMNMSGIQYKEINDYLKLKT